MLNNRPIGHIPFFKFIRQSEAGRCGRSVLSGENQFMIKYTENMGKKQGVLKVAELWGKVRKGWRFILKKEEIWLIIVDEDSIIITTNLF